MALLRLLIAVETAAWFDALSAVISWSAAALAALAPWVRVPCAVDRQAGAERPRMRAASCFTVLAACVEPLGLLDPAEAMKSICAPRSGTAMDTEFA